MNEIIQKATEVMMEMGKLIKEASTKREAITEEQYQSERRKRILAHLRERITSKRINLDVVAEWAGKSVDYCRSNIFHRGKRNNIESRWAVDVVVFLCDLWAIAVPSWCKEERIRQGLE